MNIAIISTNKDKYSETFIHNHVKRIPADIHFLFDGYLPKQYSTDKGRTSHLFKNYKKNRMFGFFKKNPAIEELNLRVAIERYLKDNRVDLIFAEYGPSGVEMMELSEKCKIPLLVHFHGYDAYRQDILGSYGKKYHRLFEIAKAIVVVSKHMYDQIIRLGCESSKVHLIPYGIDTELFNFQNNSQRDQIFVSCSRFVAKKAPDITIKAFAKLLKSFPSAKLIMIGDGELHAQSVHLAMELGVEHAIQFTGKLSQQQIASIYHHALAFIHPSITTEQHDSEGTPLTLLEAGACGLPAISTKHGGISDVIIDRETGFLVDENDLDGLTQRMMLLSGDPGLALNMGKKANERIKEKYTIESYTQKLVSLINGCI